MGALERVVRCFVGNVKEEGAVLIFDNEIDGVLSDEVSGVSLLGFKFLIVPPVLHSGLIDVRKIINVAADVPSELIEAMPRWIERFLISQVPLSHQSCRVPLITQGFGQGPFRILNAIVVGFALKCGDNHAWNSCPLRIATGHQSGSRRAANNAIAVKVGEFQTGLGECVQVRRRDPPSKGSQVTISQIIRQNDDHVGRT